MMEQGRGDYGSNKTGGWLKDIFKKKEGSEDDVATGSTAADEGVERQWVVQDNLMTLPDIGEEDEKVELEEDNPKTNGSFVGNHFLCYYDHKLKKNPFKTTTWLESHRITHRFDL